MFTYNKVCLYDGKHIRKMEYPAENKNAEYLKLLSERKGTPATSITVKDSTKVAKEASPSITKRVSSGVSGMARMGSTTVATSIKMENSQPHSNKRKICACTCSVVHFCSKSYNKNLGSKHSLSQERVKEEVPIQEKEVEFISITEEQTSEKKVLNPVHTFVRTRLFGGKKGRCWAKRDEATIIQSERKTEDMEMVYPAENKNAQYLKLLSERKGTPATSITVKDSTKVAKEATPSITKKVSSGVAGMARMGSTTVATSIKMENSQPHSNKRKICACTCSVVHFCSKSYNKNLGSKHSRFQERVKEEEPIQEKEVEFISIEKEQTSKEKVLNPVHTFVRTRLFGGKKGRCWAKQDEAAVIPSVRKVEDKEMVRVPEDGSGKPTKAQRKALKGQEKQEAKSKRLETPENVEQDLAEAKRIKHSAVVATNDRARRARVPKDRQHPVRHESGYAMSQRGFNLNNRLLEGTHHQENQSTTPQTDSWVQAFPRSNVTYDFTNQLFCNGPSSAYRPYSYNPTFMELRHTYRPAFTDGPNNPTFMVKLRHTYCPAFANRLFCNSLDRPYIQQQSYLYGATTQLQSCLY